MSAAKVRLKVVPEPEPAAGDEAVMACTAAVVKTSAATIVARDAMTAARKVEHTTQQRYDSGDQAVALEDLARIESARKSAERKHEAAETAENVARIALAQEEKKRADLQYAERAAHAQTLLQGLAPLLQRFAAIDAELAKVVEEAVDVVVDRATAYERAVELELASRPVISLAARNVEAPTIEDAKHFVRVFIARNRARVGQDGLCDSWLSQLDQPDWRDANRQKWNAAVAVLSELEKSNGH